MAGYYKRTAKHRELAAATKRGNLDRAMYGKAKRVRDADVDHVLCCIARRIDAKRIELDVPANELHAAAGIHPATLSHIARNHKRPTLRTLVRLALALGITLEELIA